MPPTTAKVAVYVAFCVPFGKEEVATVSGGGATKMLRACVADWEFASVTCTVKLVVPVPVGVPEIAPVLGARESPAGREPMETDQV